MKISIAAPKNDITTPEGLMARVSAKERGALRIEAFKMASKDRLVRRHYMGQLALPIQGRPETLRRMAVSHRLDLFDADARDALGKLASSDAVATLTGKDREAIKTLVEANGDSIASYAKTLRDYRKDRHAWDLRLDPATVIAREHVVAGNRAGLDQFHAAELALATKMTHALAIANGKAPRNGKDVLAERLADAITSFSPEEKEQLRISVAGRIADLRGSADLSLYLDNRKAIFESLKSASDLDQGAVLATAALLAEQDPLLERNVGGCRDAVARALKPEPSIRADWREIGRYLDHRRLAERVVWTHFEALVQDGYASAFAKHDQRRDNPAPYMAWLTERVADGRLKWEDIGRCAQALGEFEQAKGVLDERDFSTIWQAVESSTNTVAPIVAA
ncbi:hypothetical protein [Roseomonas genomospecies 6]|uniref:Uncharacterized protein n=1 Tax=Roseomonas genomospecies 6 TaxID=214106 RepID=A0A9W7NEK4_9PROT|nr:hypothetical protein [Roseomonas genomospecies 6]KAA0677643.1 hypothetical protein DS843_22660 [Roseomonas genomospecies 6]